MIFFPLKPLLTINNTINAFFILQMKIVYYFASLEKEVSIRGGSGQLFLFSYVHFACAMQVYCNNLRA